MCEVGTGDQGQVLGHGVRREPADLAALARLAYRGRAGRERAEIGRRDPVLAFCGQDMVDDVQERADLDLDAVLFAYLAAQRIAQPLAKLNRAAGEFP